MRKHLKNMTAIVMQREFHQYKMLPSNSPRYDGKDRQDSLNYEQFKFNDFGKRTRVANQGKARLQKSKRLKYLEEKIRHLEEHLSKEGSKESQYFFWFIMCWSAFKLVSLLRYAFAWLYQNRSLPATPSLTMQSPFRPVTRRLNRMFQSFIQEKASSHTKAGDE